MAALGFAGCSMPYYDRALWATAHLAGLVAWSRGCRSAQTRLIRTSEGRPDAV